MIYCHSLMLVEINNKKNWNDYDDNTRIKNTMTTHAYDTFIEKGKWIFQSILVYTNYINLSKRFFGVCILFETFFTQELVNRVKATMKLIFKSNNSQDSKNYDSCLVDDNVICRTIARWDVAVASCFFSCYLIFFLAAHFSCSTLCSTGILGKCHQTYLFVSIFRKT